MKTKLLILLLLAASQLFAQTQLAPYITQYAGAWPQLVKIADINGDGRKDVVVADGWYFNPATDGALFAFIQNSAGGLNAPVITHFNNGNGGTSGMGIDAFDFDGDGLDDIVIGFEDTVKIFKSLGNGSFQLQFYINSGTGVDGISIGDLDNDGYKDIAVSHWNSSYIRIMWGEATPFQFTQRTYGTTNAGYDQILISKLGRDTVASLIYMRGQGTAPCLEIYKFNSNRFVADSIIISNVGSNFPFNETHSIAVGDRQNDGYKELAVTWGGNVPGCAITFFDSLYNVPSHVTYTADIPEALVSAQMNCIPGDEYIIAHGGWDLLSVVSKSSITTFPLPYASHYSPQGIDAGDINNDGYNDVVVADYNHGLVILYNQSGMSDSITASKTSFCNNDSSQICITGTGSGYIWNNGDTTSCIYAKQAGYYYASMTNVNGCRVQSDTILLAVHQVPQVYINAINDTIVATGQGYYNWYIDGIAIPGDTTSVYVAASSGEYYVTLTDTNQCSGKSNLIQHYMTGVFSLKNSGELFLYPNPSVNGILQITVNNIVTERPLVIFDMSGREVYRGVVKPGSTLLDLGDLSAGVYTLHIDDTAKQFVIK